ncbi:hypothetical protein [Haloferula sp.]|uniref:hypothetical protein n=1 Tax=Haloferula sp. TaxID=2497595 RepID=UPI003C760261
MIFSTSNPAVFPIFLALAVHGIADEVRTERVQFAKGADSATLEGEVSGRDAVMFQLNARDSQFLTVNLESESPYANFNIYIPGRGFGDEALFTSDLGGRNYLGQLYKSGDHRIAVFLNRGAARDGKSADFKITFKVTADAPETEAPAAAAFTKSVSYDGISFTVTSPQSAEGNKFTITPTGLSEVNEPETFDVTGKLIDVMCDDIDGDNSPEIAVIFEAGENKRRSAQVFSSYNRKSFGMVNFRDVTDEKRLNGYRGGDEFQFVEGSFIRRFPVTGEETKTRQFQFKLKDGEAMKQLTLDRQADF